MYRLFLLTAACTMALLLADIPARANYERRPEMATSLLVTPTSFPENTDTLLTFTGSGWNPNAQLIIGIQGETSGQVENIAADGTFTRTWQSGLRHAGGAKAFANSIGGDDPDMDPTHQELVNLHVTNVH